MRISMISCTSELSNIFMKINLAHKIAADDNKLSIGTTNISKFLFLSQLGVANHLWAAWEFSVNKILNSENFHFY